MISVSCRRIAGVLMQVVLPGRRIWAGVRVVRMKTTPMLVLLTQLGKTEGGTCISMSDKIYKYKLSSVENLDHGIELNVLMALGADILHVDIQNQDLCVWAAIDDRVRSAVRRFKIVGTGFEPPNHWYIGTVLCGQFVWHIYDLGEQRETI